MALVKSRLGHDFNANGVCQRDKCDYHAEAYIYDSITQTKTYCDTVAISRKVWPELSNHKLGTVGAFLHIRFHHHNALDDAKTCAAIPIYAGRAVGVEDFSALAKGLGVCVQKFGQR